MFSFFNGCSLELFSLELDEMMRGGGRDLVSSCLSNPRPTDVLILFGVLTQTQETWLEDIDFTWLPLETQKALNASATFSHMQWGSLIPGSLLIPSNTSYDEKECTDTKRSIL